MADIKFGDELTVRAGRFTFTGKFIGMHDRPAFYSKSKQRIPKKKIPFVQPVRSRVAVTNKYDHKALEIKRNREALGIHPETSQGLE